MSSASLNVFARVSDLARFNSTKRIRVSSEPQPSLSYVIRMQISMDEYFVVKAQDTIGSSFLDVSPRNVGSNQVLDESQ